MSPRLLKLFILATAITLSSFFSSEISAQSTIVQTYDIGSPDVRTVWVDINSGSDSNSGNSASQALRSISAAWNLIPQNSTLTQGYQINIRAGTYGEAELPNYWENRLGTATHPIILSAYDGNRSVVFSRDINAYNVKYFYLLGIDISPAPAGDAFHCELCDHILLRDMSFDGGSRSAHETIKVNQSQYVYIENSNVHGADDNAIDFVAVQYGHIINSRIYNAGDWCTYVKGGSAYITIANNLVYDCGTGGITAGQGTGLEFMVAPWIRYEAQSIKIFNNIVYDTEGAAFGVNGGVDILIAHNTAYRIGSRSHVLEAVFGSRSCDGNNAACANRISLGGWGPSNSSIDAQPIPNKNVYIYNNIFYNPSGFQSQWQHFAIYGPQSTLGGSNIPSPARTDSNLVLKGNLIWNGSGSMPLGIGSSDQGCYSSNTTCNQTQLISDNFINTIEPNLRDPAQEDFRPTVASSIFGVSGYIPSAFIGEEHAVAPVTPVGVLENTISQDFSGVTRTGSIVVGAYSTADGSISPQLPIPDTEALAPTIVSTVVTPGLRVRSGRAVTITAQVTDDISVSQVTLRVGTLLTKRLRSIESDIYRARFRVHGRGRFVLRLSATDGSGQSASMRVGRLVVR